MTTQTAMKIVRFLKDEDVLDNLNNKKLAWWVRKIDREAGQEKRAVS